MQNSHKKVLNQFKAGTLEILVCTDSLARGIDIGLVDTVMKAKDLLLFLNLAVNFSTFSFCGQIFE